MPGLAKANDDARRPQARSAAAGTNFPDRNSLSGTLNMPRRHLQRDLRIPLEVSHGHFFVTPTSHFTFQKVNGHSLGGFCEQVKIYWYASKGCKPCQVAFWLFPRGNLGKPRVRLRYFGIDVQIVFQ